LRCNFASLFSFCALCIVGARGAWPISGAKHRAPTIKAIGLATFYEIIKIRNLIFKKGLDFAAWNGLEEPGNPLYPFPQRLWKTCE
jgi:hypothetical protein